jgi:hypothetical protein
VSDEVWFARLTSRAISGQEDTFCTGVRARDGGCVISGEVNDLALWGNWAGFQAAHVFPLEHESLWIQYNYGRWITNMDGVVGISKIHSTQNGAAGYLCQRVYTSGLTSTYSLLIRM